MSCIPYKPKCQNMKRVLHVESRENLLSEWIFLVQSYLNILITMWTESNFVQQNREEKSENYSCNQPTYITVNPNSFGFTDQQMRNLSRILKPLVITFNQYGRKKPKPGPESPWSNISRVKYVRETKAKGKSEIAMKVAKGDWKLPRFSSALKDLKETSIEKKEMHSFLWMLNNRISGKTGTNVIWLINYTKQNI